MSSYAVLTEDVEADFALEPDGMLGVCLARGSGDQISVDLTPAEARALRDWLVRAVPDA